MEARNFRVRMQDASTEEEVDQMLACAKELLGEQYVDGTNQIEYLCSPKNTPMVALNFVILLLILISTIVIFLVINLLLKTLFVKREKEFGIKKAIGFTGKQIRTQIALSLFPIIFAGGLTGSVLGYFYVNSAITLIFSGFGILDANFKVLPIMILIVTVTISLVSFGMSYLLSGKIKQVSVMKLIQE